MNLLSRYGFWSTQHQARTDMVMFFSLLYLMYAGQVSIQLTIIYSVKKPIFNGCI
ncbi:hypothetical protein GCHA_4120 [Paraglaciecola chathamensis S18K6]|uniref:Uncharacterized protein n=1 Tax=Paraglaciecola chathamensis S18K6 TaxID=1127672 RepID=A0AAV3V518_9ALTE|nr:hypothetical protein GCHA_4120 [Paraglaciecola chathamensis S18K6]